MAQTENNAISYSATEPRVSFFFETVRSTTNENLCAMLQDCWACEPLDTLKLLFHLRDCRGGKAEKKLFQDGVKWLIQYHPQTVLKNFDCISFYGSYKDLFVIFLGTPLEQEMLNRFCGQLQLDLDTLKANPKSTITLAAKWAPSESKEYDKKFRIVKKLTNVLKVNKQQYRTLYLTPLRTHLNIVEKQMCDKNWMDIDFEKLPSVALKKYAKAFKKHTPEKYQQFLANVKSGKQKMNVGQLQPHEILKNYIGRGANDEYNPTTETTWNELVRTYKEKIGDKLKNALAICDVSGSMNGQPLEVAVSLSLFLSQCNSGYFAGKWLSFSTKPVLQTLTGNSVREMVLNMIKTDWEMSTNLQAVFNLIFETARNNNLKAEDMPSSLFIFSDMQFDLACQSNTRTNFEEIERKYHEAGYVRPKIVFWNLRANTVDFPVPNENVPNTSLVSGFSPALLELFLDGHDISPYKIMRKAIDAKRYDRITL